MTDVERGTLQALANVSDNFRSAVIELYEAPEVFIKANFNGIFSDLAEANAVLLDHPAQVPAADQSKKSEYIYNNFVPVLKCKLRSDAMTQHIAALIGLSQEATALLIAEDVDHLMEALSTGGFSAAYYGDASWNNLVLNRTDPIIDFSWGAEAPDPLVPDANFSARWKAYIAAPASGEYTLLVETEEADEAFNLYLDDALIREKVSGENVTSKEVAVTLNASKMHVLTLEYAETSQNAGIRLYWKRAATAREIIPASAASPQKFWTRLPIKSPLITVRRNSFPASKSAKPNSVTLLFSKKTSGTSISMPSIWAPGNASATIQL